MARQKLPPVNQSPSPFGQTAAGFGTPLDGPLTHPVVQHPNRAHTPKPQATPFLEGSGALNGFRGRARHSPEFSAPGLAPAGRK